MPTAWWCRSSFWKLWKTFLGWKQVVSLLEVVAVIADVDYEDRVGNSFLQIWELRIFHKAKLLFKLWAQGLVKILKLEFGQYYVVDVVTVADVDDEDHVGKSLLQI